MGSFNFLCCNFKTIIGWWHVAFPRRFANGFAAHCEHWFSLALPFWIFARIHIKWRQIILNVKRDETLATLWRYYRSLALHNDPHLRYNSWMSQCFSLIILSCCSEAYLTANKSVQVFRLGRLCSEHLFSVLSV